MGFWDLFKKKQTKANSTPLGNSKEEIIKNAVMQMAQKSPSEHFATGAVFDIASQQHETLENIVRSGNATALLMFFADAYKTFCSNPGIVNFSPAMVNANLNDTNPNMWNADIFESKNGNMVAQCYMPIQNAELSARIIGIVLSEHGDGYYYCMLNKDENSASDVKRNKALFGSEKVGEVKGRGFELMHGFRDCITKDYDLDSSDYRKMSVEIMQGKR